MNVHLQVAVITRSGIMADFDAITPGADFSDTQNGISVLVGREHPYPVTVKPASIGDPVASIEFNLFTDIKNYHKVFVPCSGRNYINFLQLVSFWQLQLHSAINDFKLPIYIFTGQDRYMSLAYGVIGKPYETFFRPIEPVHKRALMVSMRRLALQVKRGTPDYPIPKTISQASPDGAITEHVYFRTEKERPQQPWISTIRDFSTHMKKVFSLPDVSTPAAMNPLWCSWTDWFSDTVTDEVIVENVKEGVKLGIKNFIIDDGWFGPGLDNDYDVSLNLGDWRPDPAKIKDMNALVKTIKSEGAHPMIWCAPHAVADGAKCFRERTPYLIADKSGVPAKTHNGFHVLCFMSPQARDIMAGLCADFIKEWDFDGAKYDLFNCVPPVRCENPNHTHDVESMMEGLSLTLEAIDKCSREVKKDYIVELKQNYGTPFLAQWGSMMRAGDTPYNTEGNFLRTLYNNSYTPYSINDYQTITNNDTPEEAAVIVLKMMAAGIPTYSIDFKRLNEENKAVIRHLNAWYVDHLCWFANYRIPLDPENNVLRIELQDRDLMFLINEGGRMKLTRKTTVALATFMREVLVETAADAEVEITDCMGKVTNTVGIKSGVLSALPVAPGCIISIAM
ncbi:MAG: hypothetical protein GF398_06195 [Chitinivibrionales bacterium]|nr:hypothetical protein [Chitinivibrionales bacterium]